MNEQDPVFWEWLRKKVREDQLEKEAVIQLEITVPVPTERDHEEQKKYEEKESADTYVDHSVTPETVYQF